MDKQHFPRPNFAEKCSARVKGAVTVCVADLLHDCAGTLNELPLGEAVSGAELQSSSFLDQVDAAMSQLLHPCLDLEANLKVQTAK